MNKSKAELLREHLKEIKSSDNMSSRQPEYLKRGLEPIKKMNSPAEESLLFRGRKPINSASDSNVPRKIIKNELLPKPLPTVEAIDSFIPSIEDHVIQPGNLSGFTHEQLWSKAEEVDEINNTINEFESPNLMENAKDIAENQFCLILRGQMVKICDSLQEIEEVIESLLFSDNHEISDLDYEDFAVLKRLPIKVGVLIKE